MLDNIQGYRTTAGLILILLGWAGIGKIASEEQVGNIIDALVQLAGIVFAAYGSWKKQQALNKLGGYERASRL